MARRFLPFLALALAAPSLAWAMSAAEAKKTFFGYDMNGVIEGTDQRWRECINPNGTTAYWFDGQFRKGFLRVRDDGMLCFSYPNPKSAPEDCFAAHKTASGWRFTYEFPGGDTFIASHVRKVNACPGEDAPVS
jgi:hypothetical protein